MLTDKAEDLPFVQHMVVPVSFKDHQILLNQYMHKRKTCNLMNYTDGYQKAPLHPVLRIHMGISTIKFHQNILEISKTN